MFTVVIDHIDTAARPNGKRFDVITTKVERPTKSKAWKLCLDTQSKASNTPTVALVNITVLDEDHVPVWSLH